MSTNRVEINQELDEYGLPVEFTWDLFPLVAASETQHLDENGLPKKGTLIQPGMILVGKIGRTKRFDPTLKPSALEIHGLSFEELRAKYGHLWKNYSVTATTENSGLVERAFLKKTANGAAAIIDFLQEEQWYVSPSRRGPKRYRTRELAKVALA